MADTQLDNLQGQITILKSALEGLAISFGELLMPAIKQIVGWVQKFVEWLNSLDDGTKKTVVTIALLAAALGPVLIVVGKVVSAVGTIMTVVPKIAGVINTVKGAFAALNTTMLANPIVLIVAAIAALVAAFIYLWNNCDGFRQFWIDLWENIKQAAITAWEAVKSFLTTAWEAIKNTATTIFEALKAFFSTIWEGIKLIFSTVAEVIKTIIVTYFNVYKTIITTVFNAIKIVVTTVWNAIKTVITTVVTAIQTFITTAWNTIKTVISTVVNAIRTVVSGAFNAMWTGITTTVGNIVTTIKTGFQTAVSFITGLAKSAVKWGTDIIDGIVKGIKNCIGKVKDAVSNVAETIKSFLHFSVPDEGPLTDYESWMPDFMSGLADGIEKSRGMVTKEMEKLTDTMNLEKMMPDMNASMSVSTAGNGMGGENATVKLNQPILLDGKVITTLVSQIQYSNGQASLRNLGIT